MNKILAHQETFDCDWRLIIIRWSRLIYLTHWGRRTHICVSKLTSIGSDNGLTPIRRQAIIRTNAAILFIRAFHAFSVKKMCLKVSCSKWRQICLAPLYHVTLQQMFAINTSSWTGYVVFLMISKFELRFNFSPMCPQIAKTTLDRQRLDIDPTRRCLIDVLSMSIPKSLISGLYAVSCNKKKIFTGPSVTTAFD